MIEEKSKKEIFKDYNLRRKMDKLFRFVNPPKSFSELKEKSLEFQGVQMDVGLQPRTIPLRPRRV